MEHAEHLGRTNVHQSTDYTDYTDAADFLGLTLKLRP